MHELIIIMNQYLLYVYEEEVREDDKEYKSLQDTYIKNASLFK